jgi:anti-anti-sigma factor
MPFPRNARVAVDPLASPAAPPAYTCARHDAGDGTVRLAVSGELDFGNAPEFALALRNAHISGGPLTLDLRGLTFMDCRSLSIVLAAAARARANGDRLGIVRGPPLIERLFALTETDLVLEFDTPLPPDPQGVDDLEDSGDTPLALTA